jgi:hypothetical protein
MAKRSTAGTVNLFFFFPSHPETEDETSEIGSDKRFQSLRAYTFLSSVIVVAGMLAERSVPHRFG